MPQSTKTNNILPMKIIDHNPGSFFIVFTMKTSLKTKIYDAQSIGNVEPIEYMTPYPSMRSLIEGQTIKFSDQIMIEESRMTNQEFFSCVQQTSHWLESLGIGPNQRVIMTETKHPEALILLYGIWNLGSSVVLPCNMDIEKIKKKSETKHVIEPKNDLFQKIKEYPERFEPGYKPLLSDEAVLSFEKGAGIRLSHYNLLVNANGLQKAMRINSRTRIHCDLSVGSMCWVTFQAILPIYCGCIYDPIKPELTIGASGNDYNLRKDIENIEQFSDNEIGICIENTTALSIGQIPMHLSEYNLEANHIKIKGHSVMMGYMDDSINEELFKDKGLTIPI